MESCKGTRKPFLPRNYSSWEQIQGCGDRKNGWIREARKAQKWIDNVRKIRLSSVRRGSNARLIDTKRDEGNYHVFCCV